MEFPDISEPLKEALTDKEYDCRRTITILKTIPEFCHVYLLLNSKKRNYNLEEHTIMVCQMFERFFLKNYCCKEFSINAFRLLLCLHDIGKPYSLFDNQKEKQWEYTIKMIEKYRGILPLSNLEYKIVVALISDDPLGLYIREKIKLSEAICRIHGMCNSTNLKMNTFMELLIIYYQSDSGAYTRQGYIGSKEGFYEKPKLEAVFEKDKNGQFIYLTEKHRLAFSSNIEEKVNDLMKGLRINNG